MNKNHKIVKINSIFNNLLFKNIIPVIFIGLISLSASYIYNIHLKRISYNYTIELQPVKLWITNESVIERTNLAPKNFTTFFIQEYLSSLPATTDEKNLMINEDKNEYIISFIAYDRPVDISNFFQNLNEDANKAVLLNLKDKYNILFRKLQIQKKLDLSSIQQNLKEFPEIYKIQKLEQAIQNKMLLDELNFEMSSNLNELEYLINNFEKLFFSNMYYSLNGWQIKDNIYNNTEIFVAGLLFWFLLSSFFLFFRSNYFKNKLRN